MGLCAVFQSKSDGGITSFIFQAWEQLVSRETPILVSTDLGSRGLDSAHSDLDAVFLERKLISTKKDELHIILKGRNLEICSHSSFLIVDEIVF